MQKGNNICICNHKYAINIVSILGIANLKLESQSCLNVYMVGHFSLKYPTVRFHMSTKVITLRALFCCTHDCTSVNKL